MPTVREYIHQAGTNNRADHRTPIADAEAANKYYQEKVDYYNAAHDWEYKGEIEGGRKYRHKMNKSVCEITKK